MNYTTERKEILKEMETEIDREDNKNYRQMLQDLAIEELI